MYNPTSEVLAANRRIVEQFAARSPEIRSATWFVPSFEHVYFGGIHTIFRFISWMKEERGVESRVVLYELPQHLDDARLRTAISTAFPDLAGIDIVLPPRGKAEYVDYAELPPTDIGVATIWYSAYALLPFNAVRAKYYFVQDYEPAFYPAGTLWALAEATYGFGYAGLVNTPGLGDTYRSYGNPTCAFVPAVELCRSTRPPAARRPVRVVLYGRPGTERNGFELLAAAARRVKARYGDAVTIISLGEDFDPAEFNLVGVLEEARLVQDLAELRECYLRADIGVCCMFTRHPSYQPLEYMAAGVAVVTNVNPSTTWLLSDGENCLLSDPFSVAFADAIGRLVEDPDLRDRLASAGEATVKGTSWTSEFERLWAFMTGTDGQAP